MFQSCSSLQDLEKEINEGRNLKQRIINEAEEEKKRALNEFHLQVCILNLQNPVGWFNNMTFLHIYPNGCCSSLDKIYNEPKRAHIVFSSSNFT